MHTQTCVENKHTFLVHTLAAFKALVLVEANQMEAKLLWRQVSHYPLSGDQFPVFIHCDRSSSSTLCDLIVPPTTTTTTLHGDFHAIYISYMAQTAAEMQSQYSAMSM